VPGDVVCVSGIVKVLSTNEGGGRNKKASQMYYLYVSVNSLVKASSGKDETAGEAGEGEFTKDFVSFSNKELQGIKKIFDQDEGLFRLLVNSFCPAIFGHELVKAGLLLALFGGKKRAVDEKKDLAIRSNPVSSLNDLNIFTDP
jgi:DNA helicase MCM8